MQRTSPLTCETFGGGRDIGGFGREYTPFRLFVACGAFWGVLVFYGRVVSCVAWLDRWATFKRCL